MIDFEDVGKEVKEEEMVSYISKGGQVIRWCVLVMKNGVTVVGDAVQSISQEEDQPREAQQVAVNNAYDKAYRLVEYAHTVVDEDA